MYQGVLDKFRSKKLPDEALDQLRALLDSYDRMRTDGTGGADQEAARLRKQLEEAPWNLWWTDIAQAELCTHALLDEAGLRARLGGWRRRLHEVVGDARYQQYLITACDPKTADKLTLSADLSECVRGVYYFYGAYGLSARGRTDVSKRLLAAAFAVIVAQVGLGFAFANSNLGNAKEISEYALATSFFAVLGAMVSVQRRLQDPLVVADPYYQYIQTSADWFGIAVTSPIFGAIFGLIIYGLLNSSLLSTKFVTFTGAVPKTVEDAAVLFVLGFAAGFAEQLIPDAINRIASRALGSVPTVTSTITTTNTTTQPGTTTQPSSNGAGVRVATNGSTQQAIPPNATTLTADAPLKPTPEAAQLGHNTMLASGADPAGQEKGVIHDV